MPSFATAIVEGERPVSDRLNDFGLVLEQIQAVGMAARTWADDASPLMPINAPGTLAYIYGVMELRQQILDGVWAADRTCGIEAVVNRDLKMRIGFQNVDRACDPDFPPNPRSAKGSASESLCGPTLFEHAGIDAGPLTGVKADGIPTYYVMVGEDGSLELSHPVISNGSYKHFHERIFIISPNRDWAEEINPDTAPLDDFDIEIRFKDSA
ncbi:hypothetical protein [Novosphingobium sp. Leaf2]|uniref:hypothetical protein n=1 Tax=Novosphingobium sp. Leaf2 TaxID=1735670 RepID=UPI0006FD094D|nr:hypothetical protein [Novosphingobium sp. Leaf2]KQM20834.1 hypothetical protein ASE49_16185 [Novosphingobium sp. Leaf2]